MLQALEDWDRSDANLERDAFRLPAGEILARIAATEQKRMALELALSRYADTLRSALRACHSLLKSNEPLSLGNLQDIHRQLAGGAQSALALVEAQTRRLKLSDRARRDELEVSQTQLSLLLQTLEKHSAELSGDTPETPARARAAALSDVLQLEAAVEVKDPADWTRTYAALRGEVKRRAAGSTSQVASAVPVIGSEQLVVPTLAGVWAYSNPSAQKKGDVYQWKAAKAEITQDGDRIEGTYECVYAVPEGEKYNPNVKFKFSGQIKSEVMAFQIDAPLKGYFQVLKQSAAEMTIAYFIENANKHGISFGEIPADSPQRLGRQAQ